MKSPLLKSGILIYLMVVGALVWRILNQGSNREEGYYYSVDIANMSEDKLVVNEWHVFDGPAGLVPESQNNGAFSAGFAPYMKRPAGTAKIVWKALFSGREGETNIALVPPSRFTPYEATKIRVEVYPTNNQVKLLYFIKGSQLYQDVLVESDK